MVFVEPYSSCNLINACFVEEGARIVLGEDVPIPQPSENIIADNNLYHLFVGKYSSNNIKCNPIVTVENAKLYITYDPWYKYELRPIKSFLSGGTSFFRTVGAAGEIEFFYDDEVGKVVKGLFHLLGKTMDLTPMNMT